MKKVLKWIAIGFVGLVVLVAIAGGGSETTDEDSSSAPNTGGAAPRDAARATPEDEGCSSVASDDCTPRVNFGGSVRVDALIWKVTSVRVADALGDQTYGLGAKADGKFVIVTLRVRSDKDESATLAGEEVKLEVGGNTYDPDNEGTTAAIGAGEEPFFLEDIGPDSTVVGKVVYDVPDSVLSKKVEVRFNELGFGDTHGYIDITSQL